MLAPMDIQLDACLGVTNRGTLWRAVREPGQDRIIRFVDQRVSDEQFKTALTAIAQRERPRMAPIVGHGYLAQERYFYVEYAVGTGCQTLEERLTAAPDWRSRLLLLHQVCDVYPQWLESPIRPLGLTARDIVMTPTGNGWYPWLLPCPPVHAPSPRDLLDVDRHILATVPPEVIRGVHVDSRGQDAYALGTLAAQAAGCVPSAPGADDAVTDQARDALLVPSAWSSAIPPFLAMESRIQALFQAIDRHRHREPGVRPPDAAELAQAVLDATDAAELAAGLDNPADAREILCLLRPEDGETFIWGTLQAATISASRDELALAKALIDEVLRHSPGTRQAWRQRADVLWQIVESAATVHADDPLVRQVLVTLDAVKGDPQACAEAYRRAGLLYLRWGDVVKAADEFYESAERDKTDFESLRLYRQCWLELGHEQNAALVKREAHRRMARMVDAGLMSDGEGRWWRDRFE